MQSGKLDQQIVLQYPKKTKQNGEVTTEWVTVEKVWAYVLTQRGSEAFESARLNARQTVRVQIRYRNDLDVTWRFIWHGQAYSIVEPPDRSNRRDGEMWLTGQVVGAK